MSLSPGRPAATARAGARRSCGRAPPTAARSPWTCASRRANSPAAPRPLPSRRGGRGAPPAGRWGPPRPGPRARAAPGPFLLAAVGAAPHRLADGDDLAGLRERRGDDAVGIGLELGIT